MKITKKAADEVRALEDSHGRVTPDKVVAAARNPKSALHRYIEWNDSIAAVKFRTEQAREIIRSVRDMLETADEIIELEFPTYVRDQFRAKNESGYTNLMHVKSPPAILAVTAEISAVAADVRRLVSIVKAKKYDLPRRVYTAVMKLSAAAGAASRAVSKPKNKGGHSARKKQKRRGAEIAG
jgi:hypothetical protein